jgi:dephospho-CoA kinase
MKLIGLTGGIGSGKSLISDIFNSLNVAVYNSDIGARKIMENDNSTRLKILDIFGEEAYLGKKLNSKKIASIVFQDKTMLEKLNAIVHPKMHADFLLWSANKKGVYVINEAAILIESGGYKKLDGVILVSAPEEIRIKRVMKRDSCAEVDVRVRINNQMNDNQRESFCRWTIKNDSVSGVIDQVLRIHQELIA